MKRSITILSAAALCGLLLAAATPPAQAAPDKTRGMAVLSATVASNGTLVRGAGTISAEIFTTGVFQVTFNRRVTECVLTASLRQDLIVQSIPGTNGIIAPLVNEPDTVFVATRSISGSLGNIGFDLLVFCAR